jgi:hypothetical protein
MQTRTGTASQNNTFHTYSKNRRAAAERRGVKLI